MAAECRHDTPAPRATDVGACGATNIQRRGGPVPIAICSHRRHAALPLSKHRPKLRPRRGLRPGNGRCAPVCLFGALFLLAMLTVRAGWAAPAPPDARALLAAMIDLARGLTSHTEMTMHVHRREWDKTSTLVAWTRGREDALIRFTAPAKDAGNATLRLGRDMWTFAPKVNRVIRLPASLMSQSWAGSDFSYDDLSRSDDLLVQYELRVTATRTENGHQVYDIEATPHADAPVVWGKQTLRLRDDAILLEETFFDQDMKPMKRLTATDVTRLGGRIMASRLRMTDLREPDQI